MANSDYEQPPTSNPSILTVHFPISVLPLVESSSSSHCKLETQARQLARHLSGNLGATSVFFDCSNAILSGFYTFLTTGFIVTFDQLSQVRSLRFPGFAQFTLTNTNERTLTLLLARLAS